jgi:hypothetical protein
MKWLLVVVVACGGRRQPTMFVRDARLVGWNLAVETCEVFADHDKIQVRECTTSMQPLPVLIEGATTQQAKPR